MKREKSPINLTISAATLPKGGFEVAFEANEKERAALIDFLDLASLDRFEAKLTAHRWKSKGVRLEGTFNADLAQPCAVTLEPVPECISETLNLVLVPEGSALAKPRYDSDGELVLSYEGDDIPDTFTGDRIDVGAILTEHLSLALDPFPRAEGAEMPKFADEEPDEKDPSPFAVLSSLKDRK